ncbi:phosphotransferase [Nocardia sp. NPDC051463]|uniref:phosphotransferase n=1 Tax=Nocardia sp. NPDC051463 TaxID=3154845 RepID=UPI00344B6F3A
MNGRAVHAPVALLGQPLEPVLDWAAGILSARNVEITGPPTQTRRRAWSLIACIPTDAGPMWLKANARAFAHEGPLLQRLAALRPGSVLEPLAVQPDHGWLLSRDGGDTATDSEAEWSALIERYVDLQQSLTTHIEDLRATGTPYLPPAQLITVYRHYEPRLPGLGAAIEESAAALAKFGRLSIEHNDVHPGNVFAGVAPETGMLFDWGDAVITHPFLSQRILTGPHREQYFECWRRRGPISDREITLAERLAPLVSLNPWRTIDTAHPRFASTVQRLLNGLKAGFR